MDVVHTQCCGIDIHKQTAVACLIVPGTAGQPIKTVRTFGTMTDDLLVPSIQARHRSEWEER
jgi:hypothetical protein